jgi:hypothetical protein
LAGVTHATALCRALDGRSVEDLVFVKIRKGRGLIAKP